MADGLEPRPELPTGGVTFLRTDIEGSMELARKVGGRWANRNATLPCGWAIGPPRRMPDRIEREGLLDAPADRPTGQ